MLTAAPPTAAHCRWHQMVSRWGVALNIRRPGAQAATNSPGAGLPLVISVSTRSSRPDQRRQHRRVNTAALTCCPAATRSRPPRHTPAAAPHHAAPDPTPQEVEDRRIKVGEAIISTRRPRPTEHRAFAPRPAPARPAWLTATPLGGTGGPGGEHDIGGVVHPQRRSRSALVSDSAQMRRTVNRNAHTPDAPRRHRVGTTSHTHTPPPPRSNTVAIRSTRDGAAIHRHIHPGP